MHSGLGPAGREYTAQGVCCKHMQMWALLEQGLEQAPCRGLPGGSPDSSMELPLCWVAFPAVRCMWLRSRSVIFSYPSYHSPTRNWGSVVSNKPCPRAAFQPVPGNKKAHDIGWGRMGCAPEQGRERVQKSRIAHSDRTGVWLAESKNPGMV